MISYYGNYYFEKTIKKDFPEEYPTIIETIPMSIKQFAKYEEYREIEKKEEAKKGFKNYQFGSEIFKIKESE